MTLEKPNVSEELNACNESFKELFSSNFGNIILIEDKNILICEILQEYVPFDEFQQIFLTMSDFVGEYNVEKLIFDKRALTTFHQPSMEWYFIVWKREMYEKYGLKVHRKILPKGMSWFKRAVEAGHAEIKAKHPENIIDKLDIEYRHSIEEAVND